MRHVFDHVAPHDARADQLCASLKFKTLFKEYEGNSECELSPDCEQAVEKVRFFGIFFLIQVNFFVKFTIVLVSVSSPLVFLGVCSL